MNKNAIQKYAVWARNELIDQIKQRAFQYGISSEGYGDENAVSIHGRVLTDAEKNQRKDFIDEIKRTSFAQAVESVAYTWFNRFIALRYMEVNDYLPTHIRVFSDALNNFKPEILKEALHIDLPNLDKKRIITLLNENKTDELYRYLLLTQCNALNDALPEMFERMGSYSEMLLPNNVLRPEGVIGRLINDIPQDDFKDAVQIIGWLYQFYNDERRNAVINIYKGTVKKDDIPAATQLFTTDWVVRYMVDNSLGRYWIERNPQSKLREKLAFFVAQESEIVYINEKISPEDLTFIDPCMGSGHILVYAFDVLMEIYRECGYSDRDAATSILQNNLYGLDIDNRAYQLAYLAVMMRARKFNRRIFEQKIVPHVLSIQESNTIQSDYLKIITDKKMRDISEYLIESFKHAKEIGSIRVIERKDYADFIRYLDGEKVGEQTSIFTQEWQQYGKPLMKKLAQQAEVMSKKYTVVATNPPYLNKMESYLKDFVLSEYKPYSGDMFSVFIYRNFDFCKTNGYSAFMSPFVWMFIKTYEKLRDYIIKNKEIATLIQMEYSAFEEATVPICSFVLKNSNENQKGVYFRLSDFKGGMDVQEQKVLEAIANPSCGYRYTTSADNFSKIPGSPIAYWVSEKLKDAFGSTSISDVAKPCIGMRTGDNNRFLRLWHEVNKGKIKFDSQNYIDAVQSGCVWVPYIKGGEFRRWYGNQDYVVNWENNGYEIKENTRKVYPQLGDNLGWKISNEQYYFKEGITWTVISSAQTGFRRYYAGNIFSNSGQAVIVDDVSLLDYLTALLNTSITRKVLTIISPTIGFESGYIAKIPAIIDVSAYDEVTRKAQECIKISRTDWDSFETSWDFKRHPLREC